MKQSKSFYATTPIYYVNDAPHIGHAYTTTLADVLVRYHKMLGHKTFFLTGTDEHGQKVQQAATVRGVSPQEHVDTYNVRFRQLWSQMDIAYDHFIRTTDQDHKNFVQECLQKLWDKGEIYAKHYEGWYSVGEERFFGENELIDGKDPISGRPVEWLQEKNYFFSMSKYQDRLIAHLEQNPDWVLPDFRRNEVLGFLRQPLADLCISRPRARLSWGIPLPFDQDFVTYVWFDALINYVSGVRKKTFPDGSYIWPATVHLLGKDILTTHAVYWPTMLMALDLPLPTRLLAHGWWLNGGAKMSKSTGNIVDPIPYMQRFGVDIFRYFLLRDMVIGQDSTFSDEAFIRRANADLANDLGNGLNRVHRLLQSHFEGKIPCVNLPEGEEEQRLREQSEKLLETLAASVEQFRLSQFVEDILQLVRLVNRYLEVRAPWKLAKQPEQGDLLALVLRTSAEALRIALQLLSPIMPSKCAKGLSLLGACDQGVQSLRWGILTGGEILGQNPGEQGLFPRIETEKASTEKPVKPAAENPDYFPLDLRVAQILQVKGHPDGDSLWVLSLDAGEKSPRTVCAGLRKQYSAEQLSHKMVVLLANLKPAPLRGIISQGMLLAADGSDNLVLLLEAPANAEVGMRILPAQSTAPAPDLIIRRKDLDKHSLQVLSGRLYCDGKELLCEGSPITSTAPHGSSVR